MLTMPEIRLQLRLESDYTDEDVLLDRLAKVAHIHVENQLHRKVFADDSALTSYQSGLSADEVLLDKSLVVTESIKHAMLMHVGELYENRESALEEKVFFNPTYSALINPYRILHVG